MRKWPDVLHWQFDAQRLGEDDHGIWLYTPADTIVRRGQEPPRDLGTGFVGLVPEGTWWIAEFSWDHPWHTLYVNIGTPPLWDGDRVTQIDLDLDVVRCLDGRTEVLDEDEFADHQVRYGYPQDLIANAVTMTAGVVDMVERATEPFGTASHRWTDLVRSREETAHRRR